MNLSYLNIRQEYARINIEPHNVRMQMQNGGKQAVLDGSTTPSQLNMSTQKGSLNIDSTPSRYARGQKNVEDLGRDLAQEGMQAIKAWASEFTQDGDALRESKGDILSVIFNKMNAGKPPPGVVLKYVDRPTIQYTPGKLSISYRPAKPEIRVEPAKIENTTQFPSIDYSLSQEASIRMWVSQGSYDIYA